MTKSRILESEVATTKVDSPKVEKKKEMITVRNPHNYRVEMPFEDSCIVFNPKEDKLISSDVFIRTDMGLIKL